jgi:sugar lactone lactonase YvrE
MLKSGWMASSIAPLAQEGGSVVAGWNAPNRVLISRNVKPGQQVWLAIFGMNPQGRLTINEHGRHRVSRLERDGTLSILAERFEGKRVNSLNDLVYRSDGTVYFTDPPFGLPNIFRRSA